MRTVAGVSMASGSTTLTRTSGTGTFQAADVGKPITGTGIPAGATVAALIASNQVTISAPATSSGAGRTVTIATTPADCTATQAPFNAPPYNGMVGTQQCQTGDSGSSPFQLQLFDNDGVDDSIAYDQPITGCQLYVPAGSGAATYKNAWASVCTFTPTTAGIYPFRIKSSAITLPNGTVVTDTGSGYNGFALRVQGATATTVQQTGELSIWLNQFASTSQVYLTEITSADAGKLMQIDMFDVGDGNVGQYTLQVLAPPSGAPGIVPSGGTVIPAPGLADSCRYNPTPSPTRGPRSRHPPVRSPLHGGHPLRRVLDRGLQQQLVEHRDRHRRGLLLRDRLLVDGEVRLRLDRGPLGSHGVGAARPRPAGTARADDDDDLRVRRQPDQR